MVYDFSHLCNTYKKDFYTAASFIHTTCPECRSIGRFKLHGSYTRYVAYFKAFKPIYDQIAIKRIQCKSCDTTHAVLPGDIIAYELLSLPVFLFIVVSFQLRKTPVLQIAERLQTSFQFIYATIYTFTLYLDSIHQFFKETAPSSAPLLPGTVELLGLIRGYGSDTEFQYSYMVLNKKPCFMGKFFKGGRPPPIGIIPAVLPLQGQQHNR